MKNILKGKVTDLRIKNVAGGSAESAIFNIDQTPVELEVRGCTHISESDSIIVGGILKNGLFKANSYINTSNNVEFTDHTVPVGFSMAFCIVSLLLWYIALNQNDGALYFSAILFSAISVSAGYLGLRLRARFQEMLVLAKKFGSKPA